MKLLDIEKQIELIRNTTQEQRMNKSICIVVAKVFVIQGGKMIQKLYDYIKLWIQHLTIYLTLLATGNISNSM